MQPDSYEDRLHVLLDYEKLEAFLLEELRRSESSIASVTTGLRIFIDDRIGNAVQTYVATLPKDLDK